MIEPVLLIVAPMAAAFLLPLFSRAGRRAQYSIQLAAIAFVLVASLHAAWLLLSGSPAVDVTTSGWPAPIGIALRLGLPEAVLLSLAGLSAFIGSLYLAGRADAGAAQSLGLQLLLLSGTAGLILTRDAFNTFVFFEIVAIVTYSLALAGSERRALVGGLHYLLLGALASTFLLLGIALGYRFTGSLDIQTMVAAIRAAPAGGAPLHWVAVLILGGLAIELKQAPLNGPTVELYDGVEPGVLALFAGTSVNAAVYAGFKLLALLPSEIWGSTVMALGALTFVSANLLALRQVRVTRMLGYSTSAQLGLLVLLAPATLDGTLPLWAGGALLLSHALGKAALLWLVGLHPTPELHGWRGAFARSALARFSLTVSVLAIVGMPPFPGFWGKWEAVVRLSRSPYALWLVPVLVGSLLELAYYFRWLLLLKGPAVDQASPAWAAERHPEVQQVGALQLPLEAPRTEAALLDDVDGTRGAHPKRLKPYVSAAPFVSALLLVSIGGAAYARLAEPLPLSVIVLVGGGGLLLLAGGLPNPLASAFAFLVTTGAALIHAWTAGFALDTVVTFFSWLVLGGAWTAGLGAMGTHGPGARYHGLVLLLTGSLLTIVGASSLLTLFTAWEIMTAVAVLLIAHGRSGRRPAWSFAVFAGASGYVLLGGVAFAASSGAVTLADLRMLEGAPALGTWLLIVVAVLVKLGSLGAHVWAPDAYSEAPDAFTPLLAGTVSKLPIFLLVTLLGSLGIPMLPVLPEETLLYVLGWLGALTAFGMTLLALQQEDAKRLLAYSSVSQLGYVVLGLATLSPLGWQAALFHALHHLLFKALLFLALSGVVLRTQTRKMYEMGGLIARMPASFVSVMIGIIALSGVPPLAGFTGKWLLYHALLDKGWLLLLAFTMFASVVAFLYLFRLIHGIFLGQLKTIHRRLRDAPLPLLLAQGVLVAAILVLSVWPQTILSPIQRLVTSTGLVGSSLTLASGGELVTSAGHFTPWLAMLLVGILFALVLGGLLLLSPRMRKVGQLDIVYAGEVPPPPEELHYAFDMFRPYARALAPILGDSASRFWGQVKGLTHVAADGGRWLYRGNAQTFLLYGMVVLLTFLAVGG